MYRTLTSRIDQHDTEPHVDSVEELNNRTYRSVATASTFDQHINAPRSLLSTDSQLIRRRESAATFITRRSAMLLAIYQPHRLHHSHPSVADRTSTAYKGVRGQHWTTVVDQQHIDSAMEMEHTTSCCRRVSGDGSMLWGGYSNTARIINLSESTLKR